ncbi:MAG: cupin domain-containing protein [Chitinophagaceae bacterium]
MKIIPPIFAVVNGPSPTPNKHVQEEIVLLLRGHVTMHTGDNFYPASPGDPVLLPSRIPHSLMNTGREQCEYFTFQWRN